MLHSTDNQKGKAFTDNASLHKELPRDNKNPTRGSLRSASGAPLGAPLGNPLGSPLREKLRNELALRNYFLRRMTLRT